MHCVALVQVTPFSTLAPVPWLALGVTDQAGLAIAGCRDSLALGVTDHARLVIPDFRTWLVARPPGVAMATSAAPPTVTVAFSSMDRMSQLSGNTPVKSVVTL